MEDLAHSTQKLVAKKAYTQLKDDFEKYLLNTGLSDVNLQIGDETFPAHKIVLSARSPIFRNIFSPDLEENRTKTIYNVHTELSKDAFKEFLRFLYTSRIKDLEKHVYHLLHAADYYQVDTLKEICESKLLNMINDTNANIIFQKAHRYNCCKELKEASFEKIQRMFELQNYDLPDEFLNDPATVDLAFACKQSLEQVLLCKRKS